MAEELKSDATIITKQESIEVLDGNGRNLPNANPLAAIFEKIESGVKAEDAVKEVMAAPPAADGTTPADPKEAQQKQTQQLKQDLDNSLQSAQELKAKGELAEAERIKAQEEAKAAEATKDDEVPEAELAVLTSDKPKTAKRIQALLKKVDSITSEATKTKKERDDQATKLKELEEKLANVKTFDPKTDEAVKQQLDELAMHRRRYELEKDPEVKTKFDDRIVEAEKPIAEILQRNGAGEALIKLIDQEGGWLKFSQSNRPIGLKEGTHAAAEVAEMIIQNLPAYERRALEVLATEQIATKREKERFFKEEQAKAVDYFKKVEEERNRGTVEYQKQVAEAKKIIEDFQKEAREKNEWLKEKEVPATATAEQKASLEDDNKHTKQLNEVLVKAINTKDVKGMLDVVMDSVNFYQERRVHAKTQAELKAAKDAVAKLQAELDKFKNAARSTPRGGSISSAPSSAADTAKKKPQSLEEALDAIASGGGIANDE